MAELVVIRANDMRVKAAAVGLTLLVVLLVYLGSKWQIGDMVATLSTPGDLVSADAAELAIKLAPGDPAALALRGSLLGPSSVEDFERAVQLSAADYRQRLEYARALEQDGQVEEAEAQFRKAVELAPSYSAPRWQLGNFLLRQNKEAEAVGELKKASSGNRTYRDQVFSLAWDLYNKDPSKLEQFAGDSAEGIASLAYFLAARGRGEEALRTWNRLPDADRAERTVIAGSIARGLFIQKVFPQALEFSRSIGLDPDAEREAVTNGSFEKGIDSNPESLFAWRVVRGDAKLDVLADSKVARDGAKSIRLTWKGYTKVPMINVVQVVAVRPNAQYKLSFWVRTESLRGPGLPLVEVLNGNDDASLARTTSFPSGTRDWQQFTLDIVTPGNCQGIVIRTVHAACPEECALSGILWYDDFRLFKL